MGEHGFRRLGYSVDIAHQLHATALTSPAGMDLGFDYPQFAAQIPGCLCRIFGSVRRVTGRDWDAIVSEQLL